VLAPLGESRPDSDAGINAAICRKMGLRQISIDQLDEFAASTPLSLIVDAIFGTGLDRPITGKDAEVIQWINRANRPVLAVDVPSGLDCNSGAVLGVAVKATRTVTFVGLKIGFTGPEAQKLLGEVVVADIGSPIELVRRFGKPAAGKPAR